MKQYNKLLAVAFLASGAFLVGCSDDDNKYVPAPLPDGPQVYIPASESTTFEVNSGSETLSFELSRSATADAATVPVSISPIDDDTPNGVFTFPSSVSFAAGAKAVPYEFTVDADAMDYDDVYQFTFKIDDAYATPYGPSEVVITVSKPAPWTLLGTGQYYDSYWGVNDDDDTYEGPISVTVWQNDLNPSLFRVQNPYRNWNGEDTFFEFYVTVAGNTYFGQVVEQDGLVVYNDYFVEYNPNYDDDVYLVFPGRFTSMADPSTWVYNRVVDYQENGLPGEIHISPYYYMFNTGGWNHTTDEPITILFPGYEAVDAEITVTYNGLLTKPDESLEVLAEIELGADVEEAKVAIIPGGNVTAAILQAIDEGTVDVTTVTQSGEVRLPFNSQGSGKYSVVALSYYNDEMRAYDYAVFNYTEGTPETWSLVTEGLYTYLEFWEENLGLEPEILELYESDATPGKFKITHWMNDQDFVFTLYSDNTIYVEPEQPTGVTAGGAEIWVDDFTDWGTGAYGELEDGIYWFAVIYYNSVSGGYYDYGYESFEPVTAAQSLSVKGRAVKKDLSKSKNSVFKAVSPRKAKYHKKGSLVQAGISPEKVK